MSRREAWNRLPASWRAAVREAATLDTQRRNVLNGDPVQLNDAEREGLLAVIAQAQAAQDALGQAQGRVSAVIESLKRRYTPDPSRLGDVRVEIQDLQKGLISFALPPVPEPAPATHTVIEGGK